MDIQTRAVYCTHVRVHKQFEDFELFRMTCLRPLPIGTCIGTCCGNPNQAKMVLKCSETNIMFNPSKRVSIVYNGWNCSRAPACILSLSRMPHVVSVILPIIVSLWWSFPALICAELHLRRWRPNHQGLWHCTPEAQRTSGNIRVQKFDCVTCMTNHDHVSRW